MSDKSTCCWNMGGVECNGDTEPTLMFDGQIQIPICESHYRQHLKVLVLHKYSKKDINEIIQLSAEDMDKELDMTVDDVEQALKDVAGNEGNERGVPPASVTAYTRRKGNDDE